jgi:hypothetical protein
MRYAEHTRLLLVQAPFVFQRSTNLRTSWMSALITPHRPPKNSGSLFLLPQLPPGSRR